MTSSANALEQLINQFSQPLAFLRELIQNSLDASTSLIEVDVGFDDDSDCCFVKVADNGHGMDRNIIDSRLTKLFASTKENDFTKIGKFGIGFVSIFAIKPELVVLDTGQHGEAWRILFLPDRSFERRELSEPVEGTSITVFVPRKRDALPKLRDECLATVKYWCKHSEIEILFDGKPINQSFDLPDVSYQFRLKTESTETVVSPTEDEDGFQGYYNRGLTLLEGAGSPHPHLRFKLRSRYLEHTLSRDNIRRDRGYKKAMSVVAEAAYEKMPLDLFQQLSERNERHLWRTARTLLRMDPTLVRKVRKIPVIELREGKAPIGELPKTVYYGTEVNSLWQDVEAAGHLVVSVSKPNDDQCLAFLRDCDHSIGPIEMEFFQYGVAEPDRTEASLLAMLKTATRQFLASPFLVESFNTPTWWEKRFCAYLNPNRKVEQTTNQSRGWRDAIGIRRAHPYWPKLLQLHALQPELAVSMLVRMVNLELDVHRKGEGRLFHSLVKTLKARSAE